MTIPKENGGKYLLITALFMVILQGSLLVGVTINTRNINENTKDINVIRNDYVPMFILEGMLKNTNYQTQEIVATIKGDQEKIKEINEKYIDFQRTMLNNLIIFRGGTPITTRGLIVKDTN